MKLLSVSSDAKTTKGEKAGYLTGILYLAPSDMAGNGINTCANASAGCREACLFTAGRAAMFEMVNVARIRKTRELFSNRAAFITQLKKDIAALVRKASRENLIPCVRINGTSDLVWLAHEMASRFPNVQFYDYTKHPEAWKRTRSNYHLTFSNSEVNMRETLDALAHGMNVAMVFPVKRGEPLPTSWNGYPIIDGDVSDLRFTDNVSSAIVGLRAKGKAKKDSSGFVQIAPLVSISAPSIA